MQTINQAQYYSVNSILRRGVALTPSLVTGTFKLLAIGDVVGLPVETWSAERIARQFGSISKVHGLETNPFFSNWPRGSYSDDTQLTLAVAKGILSKTRVDMKLLADAHVEAMRESTLGWGKTTRTAIEKLSEGVSYLKSGINPDPRSGKGNGVIMKISPIAFWAVSSPDRDPEEVIALTHTIAQMTHPTPIAAATAVGQVFGLIYNLAVTPETWKKGEFMAAIEDGVRRSLAKFPRCDDGEELLRRIKTIVDDQSPTAAKIIKNNGNGSTRALDSAPFSWAFFVKAGGSVQGMFDAINAGGDTDSNGSIVGTLVGTLAGERAAPQHLFAEVLGGDKIVHEAAMLYRKLK